jgi:hypothetical protein
VAASLIPPIASSPSVAASAAAAPSGTFTVVPDGYVTIDGGLLFAPRTFVDDDGRYDLIVHFHGGGEIVRQSVEHAGISALVAVINLGIGSAAYQEPFKDPGRFDALLAEVAAGAARKGVRLPQLRRLALTSWSAGYGAIESILEHRQAPHAERDPLDAIILLDSVHCGYVDHDPRRLNERSILPFIRAARAAAQGQLMMSVTHSEVETIGFASTSRSAALLLEAVGAPAASVALSPMPAHLTLPATAKSIGQRARMVPVSDTRVGLLRVQGFKGDGRAHHAAHLTQMAVVALPDLARRWAAKGSEPRPTAVASTR